jgi:hypothetical protein
LLLLWSRLSPHGNRERSGVNAQRDELARIRAERDELREDERATEHPHELRDGGIFDNSTTLRALVKSLDNQMVA